MSIFECLLIIFFLILFFIPSKRVHDGTDYLSLDNSTRIKGWLAIGVALNHILHKIDRTDLHMEFWNMFFWFVAIFFFFNGYGTMYKLKSDVNYLNDFLRKRVLKILIPFLIVYFLTVLLNVFLGEKYTFIHVFKSFFNGDPIASNLWYIELVLLYYLAIWVMGKTIKSKSMMTIAGFVFIILWYVFVIWRQLSPHWMFTCLLIPVGMLFAYKEDEAYAFLRKKQILLVIICGLIVAFGYSKSIEYIFTTYAGMGVAIISSVAFTILFLILNMHIQNKGEVLKFLGEISFEFYMIHGLFIDLLRNRFFYLDNDYAFVVMVILLSVLASIAFKKLLRKLFVFMKISK